MTQEAFATLKSLSKETINYSILNSCLSITFVLNLASITYYFWAYFPSDQTLPIVPQIGGKYWV